MLVCRCRLPGLHSASLETAGVRSEFLNSKILIMGKSLASVYLT